MEKVVKTLENYQPYLKKIGSNKYLRSIRDGFSTLMPLIILSSLFLLVVNIIELIGFDVEVWTNENIKIIYTFTMGIISVLSSGSIAYSLTQSLNLNLPKTNRLPSISIIFSAQISYLLLSLNLNNLSNLNSLSTSLGVGGLIISIIVAFTVPNIYFICFKNRLTLKVANEIPQNISELILHMVPLFIVILVFGGGGLFFYKVLGKSIVIWLSSWLPNLATMTNTYLGLAFIYGLMALFWFMGVQGPSILEPLVIPVYLLNVESNYNLYSMGSHATHILTYGTQNAVATLGGTGATLVITYMFAFLAKSKELKEVGKTSFIPVSFGVNEPVLFGAPLILNPVFFLPFVLTPIINVWIFKFFVDVLKMSSFIYILPWTTPGPLYIFLGTGLSFLSIIFVLILLVVDFFVYYPFFKVYDQMFLEEEKHLVENSSELVNSVKKDKLSEEINKANKVTKDGKNERSESVLKYDVDLSTTKDNKKLNILVLCAGGGTSGILANSLNKFAEKEHLPVSAAATAYGNHSEMLSGMDVVILAPQMNTMKDELAKESAHYDAKMITTNGKKYIQMTRNADEALKMIVDELAKDGGK